MPMRLGEWRISPQITAPNRQKGFNILLRLGVFAAWMLLWQIASMIVGMELMLPSPLSCAKALMAMIPTSDFWLTVLMSLIRIMGGYLIGCVIGAVLGLAVYFVPVLGEFLKPALALIRSTPVASFILLAVIWLSTDAVPMLIASLMVIPVVSGNVVTGLEAHSGQLREVAFVYGFSRSECFRRLFIPSVLPYFSTGCMTSLGLAWKAGVAAEVMAVTKNSIGIEMNYSKLYLETPQLFAWTAVVIFTSFALEKIIMLALLLVSRLRGGVSELNGSGERKNG